MNTSTRPLHTHSRILLCLGLSAAAVLTLSMAGKAQVAGTLDPDFSADGKATVAFSSGDVSGYATLIAPNGDIYVAGTLSHPVIPLVPQVRELAIARLNTDGSLDTGYDGDGKVLGAYGGYNYCEARAMAQQTDGRIVVVGNASTSTPGNNGSRRFGIARFNTDGSPDTDFSTDGSTSLLFNTGAECLAWDVAIQTDGKILVAGWTNTSNDPDSELNFALVRLNSDGTIDNTFSSDGRVQVDFGGYDSYAHAIALQNDGRIVIAGTYDFINSDDQLASFMVAARLNTDGTLDNSFSDDGKYQHGTSTVYQDNAWDVAIDKNGRIILAGEYRQASGGVLQLMLAAILPSGVPDPSFSGNGEYFIDAPQGNGGGLRSVEIMCDGHIVCSGYSVDSNDDEDFLVARLTEGGELDVDFGTDGITTTAFGVGNDAARGAALRTSDQFITIAGVAALEDDATGFGIARYSAEAGIVPEAPVVEVSVWPVFELTADGTGSYQWQFEFIPFLWNTIPEDGNTVQPSEGPGTYRVRVTSPNGCTSPWTSFEVDFSTGLAQQDHGAPGITAYPVPFDDQLVIRFDNPTEQRVSLLLVDPTGREVARLSDGRKLAAGEQLLHMDLPTDLAPGNYALILSGKHGRQTVQVTK